MRSKKHGKIIGTSLAVLCSLLILVSSGITGFAAEAEETTAAVQPVDEVSEPATEEAAEPTEEVTEEAAEEVTEPVTEAQRKDDEESLGVPSAPDVRLSNTAEGIKLEWAETPNADEYLVCGTEAGKNNWRKYYIKETEYIFGGIGSGKQFYFQVQAILKDGSKTAFSSPRGMTYIAVPVLNAVNNSFETDGTLKLSWSSVGGANRYRIARMRTGDEDYEYFYSDTNSFVDRNVYDGNTYRYQVRAMYTTPKNGTAYGWWSSSSSAKIAVWPNITPQNAADGIKTTWDPVKNTARYFVYCKKQSDSAWKKVVTNNLSYTFTGLESGQVYYFQLYADSISGRDGKFSKTKNLMYLEQPKINGAVSSTADKSVKVNWNRVKGAARYQLARRPSGEKNHEYIDLNGTSYTDRSVPCGKTCSYQVRAISADGVCGWWSDIAVGEMYIKPEITACNTENGIRASWNKTDNASSYTVYYKEASDKSWSSADTTSTSYTVSADPGKLYFFQLRYTGKGGGLSPFSDVKSMTYTKQGALLSVRTSGKAVYLRWAELTGADYYVIEKTNVTTGKKGSIVVYNTEYTDNGAVYDNTSAYRVCGVHRETERHKVYDNAAGAYSSQIKINPKAYNMVRIGLAEQGNKGYKYCNDMNNGRLDEWCAIFAGWMLKQGGYTLKDCGYHANVGYWCDNLAGMGKFSVKEDYTPVTGDLIIFGRATFRSHIGIVVSVSDGYVTTIEGNAAVPSNYSGEWMANSYVIKKEYSLDNSYIYGYGRIIK